MIDRNSNKITTLIGLPTEILSLIFNYVTTFDVENLVMSCKFLLWWFRYGNNGLRYLRSQQSFLSAEIIVDEQISQLHTIAISFFKESGVQIMLNNREETKVVKVEVTLTGRPILDETTTELRCNLLDKNPNRHDLLLCRFCQRFHVTRFEEMIDKQYRVFFQNWQDTFKVTNAVGVTFNILIRHQPVTVGWDLVPVVPVVETSRYGIRLNSYHYSFMENLTQIRNESDIQNIQIADKPRLTIYNPWA